MLSSADPVQGLFAVARAIAGSDPAAAPDAALAEIGPRFDADRVWLIRFDPELTQLWVSHEWCADEVPAFLPDFPGVPIGLIAVPMLKFRRGVPVVYADIEKLPPDAQVLKEEMRREGNRATAGVPLFREGRIVALLGLDDVRKVHRWTPAQMSLLGRLGELVLTVADRNPPPRATAHFAPAPVPSGCYLRSSNCHVHVSWPEIVSIHSEGDYSRVRLHNGREFLELKGLAVWEAALPSHYFGRVHRSWIVGWSHVERIRRTSGGRWTLHLRDAATILPVGRRYQPAVRLHINLSGN